MNVTFTPKALTQYIDWQTEDKKTLKKINALIKDIQRNGLMKGIGKPEVLKHRKGYSRHIDDANRLEYDSDNNENLVIISCKGHYDDK
jgi:toxin YoeB